MLHLYRHYRRIRNLFRAVQPKAPLARMAQASLSWPSANSPSGSWRRSRLRGLCRHLRICRTLGNAVRSPPTRLRRPTSPFVRGGFSLCVSEMLRFYWNYRQSRSIRAGIIVRPGILPREGPPWRRSFGCRRSDCLPLDRCRSFFRRSHWLRCLQTAPNRKNAPQDPATWLR